jgi:hypothetical protein
MPRQRLAGLWRGVKYDNGKKHFFTKQELVKKDATFFKLFLIVAIRGGLRRTRIVGCVEGKATGDGRRSGEGDGRWDVIWRETRLYPT